METVLGCLSAVLGAGGLVGQACFENKQVYWEEMILKSRYKSGPPGCLHLFFPKNVQLGFLLLITNTETEGVSICDCVAIHCSYALPLIVVYEDHDCLCPHETLVIPCVFL